MTFIDADPYPWPWDGVLAAERLAVVVAGAQNYWRRRTISADDHLAAVCNVTNTLREAGARVVWVRHGRRAESRIAIPLIGSADWELAVRPAGIDVVVESAGQNGCYGGPLDPVLRGLGSDRVVLCGLGLEGPVHSTLRSLNDRGYECLTLTDACAPHELASAEAALSSITMSFGIFGAVAPSASLLNAFEPEFVAKESV